MADLDVNKCKELFAINNGNLVWIKGRRKGSIAGCLDRGYVRVKVLGVGYYAHRIILTIKGFNLDGMEVDHIDGDKSNNKIENLRVVSKRENSLNQKIPKNNKSGVIGVCWCKNMSKWMAHIGGMKSEIFDSLDAAKARRLEMERELGYHQNHGCR